MVVCCIRTSQFAARQGQLFFYERETEILMSFPRIGVVLLLRPPLERSSRKLSFAVSTNGSKRVSQVDSPPDPSRYTNLFLENILPLTQHGAGGKGTAKALQCLLNMVRRGWNLRRKLQSTLLSFDFESAFPKVNHRRLLDTLKRFGMPNWMIRFVASFLSQRCTTLELPGHKIEEGFWVLVSLIHLRVCQTNKNSNKDWSSPR